MAVITMTSDGIVREGVSRTEFFTASRAALIEGGFETTSWVDYLIGHGENMYVFVTIKKDKLLVSFLPFRRGIATKKVQKVLDLLK